MTFADWRRRAEAVRGISLEEVLRQRGARRDPQDRSKWRTERGSLSVTGSRFCNWSQQVGGGGAIDLLMHLAGVPFRDAVVWLEQQSGLGGGAVIPSTTSNATPPTHHATTVSAVRRLSLPEPSRGHLPRVLRYLTETRRLPLPWLEPLIAAGKLYADHRGNVVFLLVAGRENRPIGAELRGTSSRVWRGMAAGTDKDAGFFWVGQPSTTTIVLCESAIDAMSCCVLFPDLLAISAAGVRSHPAWLSRLITRGYQIACGYDNDEPGELAAQRMIRRYPSVTRFRPTAHDWNDDLIARRS